MDPPQDLKKINPYKEEIHHVHVGNPPKAMSKFATTIVDPKFPPSLVKCGRLIYDINKFEHCLPPPLSPFDRTLRFDSRFESGNLSQVYSMPNESYHAILEPDINKADSCQWFYFKITNVRRTIKYTFFISGFYKPKGVLRNGSKVFFYSEKMANQQNVSWTRGGSNYAYGRFGKTSTLQLQIQFPFDDDEVFLSYSVPYTYSNLLSSIANWSNSSIFHSETLCQTPGGHNVPIITIGSDDGRPMLFFTARAHPGESNGSIVLHGLIDYLLSPSASFLTQRYVVKIVPMICVDGVIQGNYRSSVSGIDLNRVWINPSEKAAPVVFHVKQLLEASKSRVSLYMDFHGHSKRNGIFAYGCPNDSCLEFKDKEKELPRFIASLSNEFDLDKCVFSYPESRKAASRIVVRREFDVIQSFTIESSFGGIDYGPMAGLLFDERSWKIAGAKCGEAICKVMSGERAPIALPMRKKSAKEEKYAHLNDVRRQKSEGPIVKPKEGRLTIPVVNGGSRPVRALLSEASWKVF